MNLIDRVILEWSYKTKKGYPDINSQEDMYLFESLFGFNILERKGENEAKIISQLVSRFPGKYGKMSDPIRIANKEGIDNNEFIKDLKSVTNSKVEIKPISPSDRFTSFNLRLR